jgi:transcriptional regulator with XRE-family HTH domain
MAFCPSCCSETATTARVEIPASDLGLPSGTLRGVEVTICHECGEETTAIPAHGAVIKEFRKQLAHVARPLSVEEFAYLRRALGVTGKGYAEALGVSNVTISRVEHGEGVPALQDALVRALTLLDMELDAVSAIAKFVDRVDCEPVVDVVAIEKSRPRDISGGWRPIVTDENFGGNVVPIRRNRLVRKQLDAYEFEATVEGKDFKGRFEMRLACSP